MRALYLTPLVFAMNLALAAPSPSVIAGYSSRLNLTLGSSSELVSTASAAGPTVLSRPGASFLKIHFSYINLPQGAVLTVSNPSGSEVYTYRKGRNNPITVSAERGDNGLTRYSAMSIDGDTLHLHLERGPNWDASKHIVQIDSVVEGVAEDLLQVEGSAGDIIVQPNKVIGAEDRKDAACYASSHPKEFERSRPVARLLIDKGTRSSYCTGWRVGAGDKMLTNNHCVSTPAMAAGTEVQFNYQTANCGSGATGPVVKVQGKALLDTDATLDYGLFTLSNPEAARPFGYFGLETRDPRVGETIFIPQHGAGKPKQLAIFSDQNRGLCAVDGVDAEVRYRCDTEGGSSGSPVVASSSGRVLGLHNHGRTTENSGNRMSAIWRKIAQHFGNVIPAGDNEGGEPIPTATPKPTAQPTIAPSPTPSSSAKPTIAPTRAPTAAPTLTPPPAKTATPRPSTQPTTAPNGSCQVAWQEGKTYAARTVVSYQGRNYRALTTHTAFVGTNWNPAASPTLWQAQAVCK